MQSSADSPLCCTALSALQPSGSLQCTLEVQVLVPRTKGRRSSSSSSSWVSVWQKHVLISDDAARIRDLQVSSRGWFVCGPSVWAMLVGCQLFT